MSRPGACIDCSSDPAGAALYLARVFARGGRLAVFAPGADDHAHHVAVEFVHPVIAGTRPLPVAAVAHHTAALPGDTLLVIGDPPNGVEADLAIPDLGSDVDVVRTYHLLWELVQVALEHPGVVGAAAPSGGDATGFLYPFLDAAEDDEAGLRGALADSAGRKSADSVALITTTLSSNDAALARAADAIADAIRHDGRVLTMGNGGSATDAARLVRLLRGTGVPAQALVTDYAVVTALTNDVGVGRVFARQLEALARPGDVLIGCSTSGSSPNLLTAFADAAAQQLTTIGISGYGGGSFASERAIQHVLAVASPSVHRIQEAQAALISALCAGVSARLALDHPSQEVAS